MKYEITAEFGQSGERRTRVVDVGVGESMLDCFVAAGSLNAEEWELADVVPIGEEDEPIPADDRFPGRPAHPDFARLSAASLRVDEASEGPESPPEQIGIDQDSMLYVLDHRLRRAWDHPLVQLMPREIQMKGAWIDGFAVGIEYQKRGGSRPTETGTTGEKEGSL